MTARVPLENWQKRLENHFRELASTREGSNYPIFALEHGLSEADLQVIPQILDHQLRNGIPVTEYWLVWTVYAAERGYVYDGLEYWHSFEQTMRRWPDHGHPSHLRYYFHRFQKKYNGVTPTGPWAGHFKNICWPITHAILPKYFQSRFARAMYEGSHDLARADKPTPAEVGKIIAKNAWDASKRFQEFLEQEELVGRIALAMLGREADSKSSPISQFTLKRIVADLTRTRDAGEWLKEAQRVVNDRMSGLYKPRPTGASSGTGTGLPPVSSAAQHNIRPSFLMRRASVSSWSVLIEIPSFEEVARLSVEMTRFLKTSRCSIAGTRDAMLPPGWTLYGPHRRPLKQWPSSNTQLLSFEESYGLLDNILRGECRQSAGPIWVFRVSPDGLAREVSSRGVRPGQRYVILSTSPLKTTLPYCKPVTTDCEHIHASELDMPDAVTPNDVAQLYNMGIKVSKSIRVWPAGVCIQNWDGEGHGDWLTTDEPCFGITHDHPVEEYVVSINNGADARLDGAPANRPVFIRLPTLKPGLHTVSIRPKRLGMSPTSAEARALEGRIDLNVRDPRPRKIGTTGHAGLVVSLDPPNPTLSEFWEGTARLAILGPDDREVRCSISLTDAAGAVLLNEDIGRVALPLNGNNWPARIRRFSGEANRPEKYLSATKGRFVVKADELGEFSLALERDTTPLRWVCQLVDHKTVVRLMDDTGSADEGEADARAKAIFSSMERPGEHRPLPVVAGANAYEVTGLGGLYVATQGEHRDAIFVSSALGAKTMQQLRVEPNLSGVNSDVSTLLSLIDLWRTARIIGPLADYRRSHIVVCMIHQLLAHFCGVQWVQVEATLGTGNDPDTLQRLKSIVDSKASFAAVLLEGRNRMDAGTKMGAQWFSDVCKRYGVCDDAATSSFALRFASSPFDLAKHYGEALPQLLDTIRKLPALVRGARFLATATACDDSANSAFHLPRWRW